MSKFKNLSESFLTNEIISYFAKAFVKSYQTLIVEFNYFVP